MKGSVCLDKNCKNPYWYVSWPHNGKKYKISHYLGEKEVMYQRHSEKEKDIGWKTACKLRGLMQADMEMHMKGLLVFRMEKYLGESRTDVAPYLQDWLASREPNMTPAGYVSYRTAVNMYLVPFFRDVCPVMMHEIQYDTLVQLLNWLPGSGKTKKNVVDVMRCCMRYAWKSRRITSLPPFPEKELYRIQSKPPVWLPSERHARVMNALPPEHKPIFVWLYLHLRRPGEACSLLKSDFNSETEVFTIHRGISNGKVVEHTKTQAIHEIPCHEDFKPYMEGLPQIRQYFFTCSESKSEGRRYTEKLLRKYWAEACEKAQEKIDVYRGTKTSRASQMVNEIGMSIHEVQIAGDWASIESVKPYAKANIAKKRELLQRKVVRLTRPAPGPAKEEKVNEIK